jgi:putative endonuclease
MFYVYILQSQLDLSFYIGFTTDVEQRLAQHNAGLSRYTRRKTPWELVYCEQFETKKTALQREVFLKKQRNRSFYESLIRNSSGG